VIATDGDFETWAKELQPILTSVMAELKIAQETYLLRRTGSLVASGGQLRAVSHQLTDWLPERRCPVAGVDMALMKLNRSLEWLPVLTFVGCAAATCSSSICGPSMLVKIGLSRVTGD
jgi:hypothetical protein